MALDVESTNDLNFCSAPAPGIPSTDFKHQVGPFRYRSIPQSLEQGVSDDALGSLHQVPPILAVVSTRGRVLRSSRPCRWASHR